MRHETLYFTRGVCGLSTGYVDNDIEDDEVDTRMPPNWVEITARRVVKNPDWKKPRTVDEALAVLVSQLGNEPPAGIDPKTVLRAQAEMQVAVEDSQNPPEHMVEEVQFHIAPDHVLKITELDTEAFEEMGWEIAPPEKPPVAATETPVAEEKNDES